MRLKSFTASVRVVLPGMSREVDASMLPGPDNVDLVLHNLTQQEAEQVIAKLEGLATPLAASGAPERPKRAPKEPTPLRRDGVSVLDPSTSFGGARPADFAHTPAPAVTERANEVISRELPPAFAQSGTDTARASSETAAPLLGIGIITIAGNAVAQTPAQQRGANYVGTVCEKCGAPQYRSVDGVKCAEGHATLGITQAEWTTRKLGLAPTVAPEKSAEDKAMDQPHAGHDESPVVKYDLDLVILRAAKTLRDVATHLLTRGVARENLAAVFEALRPEVELLQKVREPFKDRVPRVLVAMGSTPASPNGGGTLQ